MARFARTPFTVNPRVSLRRLCLAGSHFYCILRASSPAENRRRIAGLAAEGVRPSLPNGPIGLLPIVVAGVELSASLGRKTLICLAVEATSPIRNKKPLGFTDYVCWCQGRNRKSAPYAAGAPPLSDAPSTKISQSRLNPTLFLPANQQHTYKQPVRQHGPKCTLKPK